MRISFYADGIRLVNFLQLKYTETQEMFILYLLSNFTNQN